MQGPYGGWRRLAEDNAEELSDVSRRQPSEKCCVRGRESGSLVQGMARTRL